ncbi:uncharacterized protein [Arachis hypogaea]|uniref:uncharacterized protein n=1 Tax=Arachis hypogaea TaxID=3818 RepID=UPI003B21EDA3
MAPSSSSSSIVTDSLDPSTPTETLHNDLQVLFAFLQFPPLSLSVQHISQLNRMAPSSSPIVTDSLDPSTPTETLDNDPQPFFVLHKPSSRRKDSSSTGQGKLRKRNELSSPQNTEIGRKCERRM